MIKKNKIINLLPYLVLILAIVLPWFLKGGYLFFTDMVWGPNMIVPDFTSSGHFYLAFLIKIFNFILPMDLVQKLFIVIVFAIVLFGGYKIAQGLTSNKIILFLGSAFALFNPFVYDRAMYGQFGIVLAYGFFLALLGYLIDFYFELSKRKLFLGSVFAGLSILFAAHFVFFIILVYFTFWGLMLIKKWKDRRELLKITSCFLLSVLIVGAINFNWLWGAFLGESKTPKFVEITEQDLGAFKTRGETPFEVVKNVFLMSGFWGIEQFRYEPLQNIRENWGRSFYFLLPIIVWGLIYNFKEKPSFAEAMAGKGGLNIGLILLYLVAFILALGIALPITSKITLWLFNELPFYKGLREPQKWVAVMAAVYEVLLVCGLNQLFKRKIVVNNKGLTSFLLAFIILLQAPLMVWGGAGQIKPVNYPQDWYEMNDFIVQNQKSKIKNQKCSERILFLPWHLYLSFKWVGNIMANPSPSFFKCPVIYGKNMEFGGIFGHSAEPDEREVEKWALNVGRTNLLEENKLNIGYIVLAKEVDWQNYLWIGNYPNIKLVKETENLLVYKVHPVK